MQYLPKEEIEDRIRKKRKQMEAAAKSLDFIVAAKLHDETAVLKENI
ncbi:UvrB/UvrC motif-containing protein [Polaribacter vadi]|nr:UvrB/UvrC motif-containing protein [Polaribacter vadi]